MVCITRSYRESSLKVDLLADQLTTQAATFGTTDLRKNLNPNYSPNFKGLIKARNLITFDVESINYIHINMNIQLLFISYVCESQ